MKKRFLCVLLTLLMLVSLVPSAALPTFAATLSVSESAITVLKQLEGYRQKCNSNGYIGYGTLCTEDGDHGNHTISEKKADAALREVLKDLDKAVNSFASKKGLSLTQGQHDAMVLFSFQNGTAWTTGTGDLQSAIANKATGNGFLNAICWWNSDPSDDSRRMIEANMYLNGVYSSSVPSQYIRVQFMPNGGTMEEAPYQYYDVSTAQTIQLVPTNGRYIFTGWYTAASGGARVTQLTKNSNVQVLYAHWQAISDTPGSNAVSYTIVGGDLASQTVYSAPNGTVSDKKLSDLITDAKNYLVNSDYIDSNGVKWARIAGGEYWVKLKVGATGSSVQSGTDIDVTVTVTNSYVRSRVNATIYSAQNGTYNQGDKLRIINTANADGFLWGQVAKSADDNTPIGWVALMYTNFESVRDSGQSAQNNTNAVARAVVTVTGYVNVRSDAGTDNQIVGALPNGAQVDLYETKYVNGIQWGRYSGGWFCLAYASVTWLKEDTGAATDTGLTSYAFTGTLQNIKVYQTPGSTSPENLILTKETIDPNVTVTNLTLGADGNTWGKISQGWVRVSDSEGGVLDVKLDVAKYYVVADSVTVRKDHTSSADRVDTLTKGVEFNVNQTKQIVVVGETVWGYADKVGENNPTYGGWVNLASKYVSRNGAPNLDGDKDNGSGTFTGQVATVVNTDSVRVRITGATYGQVIGSLARGTKAAVLDEKDGWYMLDVDVDNNPDTDSWVYGDYLSIAEETISTGGSGSTNNGGTTGGSTAVETGTGIVANTYSGVNVRTGAGTGYALVGKLLPGTSVEITEVKQVGAAKWGKTAQGWVCMDYITMISKYPIAGGGSSGSGSSGGTSTTTESAIYTGSVAIEEVEVMKTPTAVWDDENVVRIVSFGTPVTIHEIVEVTETIESKPENNGNESSTIITTQKTTYWARVNDGYIYNPGGVLQLDALDEKTYTLVDSDTLNVRVEPGTDKAKADFELEKGDQVTITKLQIVLGNVWGFMEGEDLDEYGWICLSHMTPGAVTISTETTAPTTAPSAPVIGSTGNTGTGGFVNNASGYKYTGKVINTEELNVRSTASTASTVTTTLKRGDSLVIYETTISENMAWGRCDAGWVYLYYVDLTPCVNGAVDARVVYNDNTIIYTDANGSGTAGTYARMSVIDIYEIVGKMAKTDLGWVNTDNLL